MTNYDDDDDDNNNIKLDSIQYNSLKMIKISIDYADIFCYLIYEGSLHIEVD